MAKQWKIQNIEIRISYPLSLKWLKFVHCENNRCYYGN